MSTQNEQAALLAEQAAHALAAARKSFINAADVADDVDSDLRRCENEIYELPNQAMLALRNTDKSERHLRIANEAADGIELRVRHGQAGLLKVRDHLDDGSRALDAGRQILTELEQLPGQQSDATDHLRSRLDRLGHAVRDAEKGVEQAGARGYARISTRPGRMPPPPRGRAPGWRWRPGSAMNPTPPSAQRGSTGSSQLDLRRRAAGPAQGRNLER
jgi:chromosome segregation ATPase